MSNEVSEVTGRQAVGESVGFSAAVPRTGLSTGSLIQVSPRPRVWRWLNFILGEAFLGFLAIIAGALTVLPMVFTIPARGEAMLETCQWAIICLFACEFALGLASAESKKGFLLNPWRVVDAATVLVPLATLIPGVSNLLRSSPVLRLARLTRLLTFGMRASGVMVRETKASAAPVKSMPMQVLMWPGLAATGPRLTTWEEFARWAKQPQTGWYSLVNVREQHLPEVERATGIPADFIASRLFGTTYPRLEKTDRFVSLFLWVPELMSGQITDRSGVLLFATEQAVITFSRRPIRLLETISKGLDTELAPVSFPARMTCRFLKFILDSNEHLVGCFEQQLRELEDLPVRDSRPQFFEQTFRLKKELSAAQADLWRLRGVMKDLSDLTVRFPQKEGQAIPLIPELAARSDYLYETVSNIREGVLSLIDLHLNVVSFEMNRVMRVLAVVSVLGLIPAVIGGLFGMNLADNPWPFTLSQVTFAVGTTMVVCLYLFVVKGWLR